MLPGGNVIRLVNVNFVVAAVLDVRLIVFDAEVDSCLDFGVVGRALCVLVVVVDSCFCAVVVVDSFAFDVVVDSFVKGIVVCRAIFGVVGDIPVDIVDVW